MILTFAPVNAFAENNVDTDTVVTKTETSATTSTKPALPEGNVSNGFINNIELFVANNSKETIPGFQYEANKTDYDVTIQEKNKFRLEITTKHNDNLYYHIYYNGVTEFGADVKIKSIDDKIGIQGSSAMRYLQYGADNVITVLVGTKADWLAEWDKLDVINFRITLVPSFESLAVSAVGETETELKMTPEFCHDRYDNEYSLVTDGTDTIKLTAKFDPKALLFIGNSDTGLSACEGQEIKLADYMVEGSKYAVIPLKLCVGEKNSSTSNEYKLVVSTSDLVPQITEQPKAIECGNGDKVTLSVGVQPNEYSTEYQWYKYSDGDKSAILGATSSTYTPDTKYTGKTGYGCYVSHVINGTRFTTASDIVNVTVNLEQVTPPEILLQPGTHVYSDGYKYEYKTEYNFGEKINRIFITADITEKQKIDYTYNFYYNTQASTENAKPLAMRPGGGILGWNPSLGRYIQTAGFDPLAPILLNECYVYCVVTATAKDNPEMTASTTSDIVHFKFKAPQLDFDGKGTEESPYLIKSADDFVKIYDLVNGGNWCSGISFRMENDITLPPKWIPIGKKGRNIKQAFGGILDGGNHTLTIPEGGRPLFELVSDAKIKNLKIYGPKIMGSGLINNYFVDYGPDGDYNTGCPAAATIENVTLLKGSSTLKSGFMDGSGSGANTITIRNCKVEDGVKIGFNKNISGIGSFVGRAFNGTMDNCVSYATVYGNSAVGGLIGGKGQAMGYCKINNSAFLGKIEATGYYIGGLIGQGYISDSAPNTMVISVENSYAAADITGEDFIGGIIGSEGGYLKIDGVDQLYGVVDAYNPNDICNNHFYGKITAKDGAQRVGGIVGYYHGVNKINNIQNNFFYDANNTASQAIGMIGSHVLESKVPKRGFADDTAYEKWLAKTGYAKTPNEFKDGTVLKLLNAGSLYKNWVQSDKYPVHSKEPIVYQITVDGKYKTEYYIDDALDFSGMKITAMYTDGHKEKIKLDQTTITGFDSSKRGKQNATIKYGAAAITVPVTVLKRATPDKPNITVHFTLLGDTKHNSETDKQIHTLSENNLEVWVEPKSYIVDINATVKELLDKVLKENNMTCDNPNGNYVKSITRNGVTIGEFTNGKNSGWMYTLNGKHPDLGVSEQYLDDGDEIIFHYTDDYTKEKAFDELNQTEAEKVDNLISAIGKVTLEKENQIKEVRDAYNNLPPSAQKLVNKLNVLKEAENKLAKLKAEAEATPVIDQIDAIGKVTLDSEKTIKEARDAYNALSEAAQKKVTNIETLKAAETKLAELKAADEKAATDAKVVDDLIGAIGKVTLDCEKTIKEARDAYNALSEAAQKKVTNLETLKAAETEFAKLKEAAALEKAKDDAKAEVNGMAALSAKQKADYVAMIDKAESENDVQAVVDAAKKLNDADKADANKADGNKSEAGSKTPKTGDTDTMMPWIVLLLGAVGTVAVIKRKKEQ